MLGKDLPRVVAGVPSQDTANVQQSLRKELHQTGLQVLETVRLVALSVPEHGLDIVNVKPLSTRAW